MLEEQDGRELDNLMSYTCWVEKTEAWARTDGSEGVSIQLA